MRVRIIAAILASLAFLGFLRMPSLDTAILAWPALMVIAILLEEAWEHFKPRELDPGPRCPQCGYDVRRHPRPLPRVRVEARITAVAGLNAKYASCGERWPKMAQNG